jgi:hypothetical protein
METFIPVQLPKTFIVLTMMVHSNNKKNVQSVPITTNVVSLNPAHGEVYSIQLYVIKFYQ